MGGAQLIQLTGVITALEPSSDRVTVHLLSGFQVNFLSDL